MLSEEDLKILSTRLEAVGSYSYAHYLKSKHWKKRRKAFLSIVGNDRCTICQRKGVEPHHVTYERVGEEWDSDLIPLCRKCHEEVHLQLGHKPLSGTMELVERLRATTPQVKVKPPTVRKRTENEKRKKRKRR